jgi:hypothetical protein
LNSPYAGASEDQRALAGVEVNSEQLTLQDPRAVLSLLEADQVVAAKRRTHFVYVVAMLVIVAISVLQAIHAAH